MAVSDLDIWLNGIEEMEYGRDFTVEILTLNNKKLRRKLQQIRLTRAWKKNPANKLRVLEHLKRFKQRHPSYFSLYNKRWRLLNPEAVREHHRACAARRKAQRHAAKLALRGGIR